MSVGGARPGAGRKPGGVNRVTQEAIEAARIGGIMPLDYLLEVMRDVRVDDAKRIDCAKAAAPYLHAKRAPVNSEGEDAGGITVILAKP